MSGRTQDSQKKAITSVIEQAQSFFEPHLEDLRLSRLSIREQDSEQLELSLATLETLITHPEQFGFFRADLSVNGDVIISASRDKATFEVGILPLLLARKQLILDRIRGLKRQHPVETLAELVEQVSDEASRQNLRSELSSLNQESYHAGQAANKSRHTGATPMAVGSDRPGKKYDDANTQGGERDNAEYKPVSEALRAGEKTLEILGEAKNELDDLARNYTVEVAQTEGLPEKIDRLSIAMEALIRTVTALSVEAGAGRDVSSLVPVAVMQKPVADGAAAEAVEAAPDGPMKKMLGKILGALKRAAEWLWSMLIHLATIREWSLGGEVHVPVFAKASLEITFGG